MIIGSYENAQKRIYQGVGEFGIPVINPVSTLDCRSEDFIGFNYAKSCKSPESKGVHFFLDDYQFLRVWRQPDVYLKILQRFKVVLTPDFSTYTDYPKALQIYNHYRKHWLGAYWQENGINVIPTISWSDEKSFDWCFDGEPRNGIVAVSSVGTQNSRKAKELFLCGYNRMLEELSPKMILFYGKIPDECKRKIIKMNAFYHQIRRRCN